MSCAHCRDAGDFFGSSTARRDLKRYRRKGPIETTRTLLDAILDRPLPGGFTVLDIGGGVGALQHELLQAGAARVTGVDASPAYVEAARGEAERQGFGDRLEQRVGDFVELAHEIGEADVVTLDRVVCCYPDMPALVGASADRARRLYGLVIPREAWWVRVGMAVVNAYQRLRRRAFRVYLHPTPAILAVLASRRFERIFWERTLLWQVMLFERRDGEKDPS